MTATVAHTDQDAAREARIERHYRELIAATDEGAQRRAASAMTAEIRARSPSQVRRMERRGGLS